MIVKSIDEIVNGFTMSLLVISVGEKASRDLLPKLAERYQDLLFNSKMMIIGTSKRMINDAIKNLGSIYRRAFKLRKNFRGRKSIPQVSDFERKIRENSILLTARRNSQINHFLLHYKRKRDLILEKIIDNITEEKENRSIIGIVMLGVLRDDVDVIITSELTRDLWVNLSSKRPLSFLTIPRRTDIDQRSRNTIAKVFENIYEAPLFILDYEKIENRAVAEKRMIQALITILRALIETFNHITCCYPPLQWDHIESIIQKECIGTISYAEEKSWNALSKRMKNELKRNLLLKTKQFPRKIKAVTIIKGNNVPLGIFKKTSIILYNNFNWEAQLYVLNYGYPFQIVSLLHGLKLEEIDLFPQSSEI